MPGSLSAGDRAHVDRTKECTIMSDFPPIADYAFLSDCEVSCLIAPDGSVEWLCLPRPDSPSVFGALLDRSAGSFRFGPSNTMVPHHRRYLPGTMVVETTWHTPTGWLVVQDLMVIRKVDDGRPTAGLPARPLPIRPRPGSCCARPGAFRARSRSWPTAYRCSTTGPPPDSGPTTAKAMAPSPPQHRTGETDPFGGEQPPAGPGRRPLLRTHQPGRG